MKLTAWMTEKSLFFSSGLSLPLGRAKGQSLFNSSEELKGAVSWNWDVLCWVWIKRTFLWEEPLIVALCFYILNVKFFRNMAKWWPPGVSMAQSSWKCFIDYCQQSDKSVQRYQRYWQPIKQFVTGVRVIGNPWEIPLWKLATLKTANIS